MPTSRPLILPSDLKHACHALFSGTLENVDLYGETGAYVTVARDGMKIRADADWIGADHGTHPGDPALVWGRISYRREEDGNAVFEIKAEDWVDPIPDSIDKNTFEAIVDRVDLWANTAYVWHAVSEGHWERWPLRLKYEDVSNAWIALGSGHSFRFEGRFVLRETIPATGRHVIELDDWSPLED
jgi:hypothetical protein